MDTESIYTIMGKTKNKMKQKTAPSPWAQLSLCKSLAKATKFTHFRLPDVLRLAAPILGSYSLFVVFVAQPLVQLLLPNTFLREPPERGLQKRKAIEDSSLILATVSSSGSVSNTYIKYWSLVFLS